MTYPIQFRLHVLSVKERECLSFEQAAERFCIGVASLKRWSVRLEPKPYERRKGGKIDLGALRRDVEEHPDAYQHERARRFGVCQKAIWQALRKLGVTYKNSLAPSQGGRRQTAILPDRA